MFMSSLKRMISLSIKSVMAIKIIHFLFLLFLMFYIGSVWGLGVPAGQPCESLFW